jgi:hypothetical protein
MWALLLAVSAVRGEEPGTRLLELVRDGEPVATLIAPKDKAAISICCGPRRLFQDARGPGPSTSLHRRGDDELQAGRPRSEGARVSGGMNRSSVSGSS